jgi:uncharacterized membrane protein HdeD (DUF308 family)
MSTTIEHPGVVETRQELAVFRRNWLSFAILGVALVVAGIVALGSLLLASLATAVAIGALLIVAGAFETVGALWRRR